MAANIRTDAAPLVDHMGDVVGVQFSQEDEVALFIPSSGDVLLCSASQWSLLKNVQIAGPSGTWPTSFQSASMEGVAPEPDLKSTLFSLGALLA